MQNPDVPDHEKPDQDLNEAISKMDIVVTSVLLPNESLISSQINQKPQVIHLATEYPSLGHKRKESSNEV